MTSLLFAYGTLKPRDPATAARDRWTPDAVRGRLYDLGPYPALVDLDLPGSDWVEGYVRPVAPEELESLDLYEDVEHGPYRRALTITRTNLRVWIYIHGGPLPLHARGPVTRWEARSFEQRS
jgi:gamma-glutamylcyclotransferase (GGCT)/AIG2-like uncharacterized protein YtfP